MGVLQYDTKIAAVVRLIGWLGMIAVVVWLWWRRQAFTSSLPRHTVFDPTRTPDVSPVRG